MDSKRIYVFDNIKGVLIFFVVFGHFILSAAQVGGILPFDIYVLIYCLHMPLFMFMSGLLTHATSDIWFKRYIPLYLIFNSLYYLVGILYCHDDIFVLNPVYSMWYILLLIVFRYLLRLFSDKHVMLLFVFSIVAYIVLPLFDLGDFFVHIKFGAFFVYFMLGYMSQKMFSFDFYATRKKMISFVAFLICCFSVFVMSELRYAFSFGFSFVNHATPYYNLGMILISLFVLFVSLVFIYSALFMIPNRKILLITTWGKNSLYIYLLHRIVTLVVVDSISDVQWIFISVVLSFMICLIFGSNVFSNGIRHLLSHISNNVIAIMCFIFVCLMLLCAAVDNSKIEVSSNSVYPEIKKSELSDCIKISYIGDMLLFEEDIVRAKSNGFAGLFDYTDSYFGDYTFGVFEGVVDENSYSTGNYYDDRLLQLRYPVEFAKEVSNHVDFVTLGMNHLMDGCIDNVALTKTVFSEIGLDFTGAFSSYVENESVKIVTVDGVKIAILSYSYGMNYTDGLLDYTFNIFDYDSVINDINKAKASDVDLIIAMTHIGTEFSHDTNKAQQYWNRVLSNNGVDVILSDHAHVVQPVEYMNDTLIFNCPGNYYTSLSGNDQEYGAICNFYIDKTSKHVVTASVVPLKSIVTDAGGQVIPLYEINDINGTNLVLENMIDVNVLSLSPEYFYSPDGYRVYYDDSFAALDCFTNKRVCFIGDSITAGTVNNLHGWYDGLSCDAISLSVGGATTDTIIDMLDKNVSQADIYVIAIGCNDIRYFGRDVNVYIKNMQTIVDMLGVDSYVYILNPWYTLQSDNNSILSYEDRNALIESYSVALSEYCDNNCIEFVDVYHPLKDFFELCDNDRFYMLDGVHPNSTSGVQLYSSIFFNAIN